MKWSFFISILIGTASFGQTTVAFFNLENRLSDIDSVVILQENLDDFVKAKTDTLERIKREIETLVYSRTSCFPSKQLDSETLRFRAIELEKMYQDLNKLQSKFEKQILDAQTEMEVYLMIWFSRKLNEYKAEKVYDHLFSKSIILYCGENSEDITDDFIDFLNAQ